MGIRIGKEGTRLEHVGGLHEEAMREEKEIRLVRGSEQTSPRRGNRLMGLLAR